MRQKQDPVPLQRLEDWESTKAEIWRYSWLEVLMKCFSACTIILEVQAGSVEVGVMVYHKFNKATLAAVLFPFAERCPIGLRIRSLPRSPLPDLLSPGQHVNPCCVPVSDDVADINMLLITVTRLDSSQFTPSTPIVGARSYSDMAFTLHTTLLRFVEKRTRSGI